MATNIDHPYDPDFTLEALQEDVNAAKGQFSSNDFCFTYVTVQALLNKIDELKSRVSSLEYIIQNDNEKYI